MALARSKPPAPRYVPALTRLRLYAREGEIVTCERGHFIGYFTRDFAVGERTCGDEISSIFIVPGDLWPNCKCGALFNRRDKGFHFRKGYR